MRGKEKVQNGERNNQIGLIGREIEFNWKNGHSFSRTHSMRVIVVSGI